MSKKKKERMGWNMKGIWYEACAAEGHCSFYFGRDREEPCKSFQLFQINEGQIGNVDISGVLAINVVDLYSNKASDLLVKGGEGGVYISADTTQEQRDKLEPFFEKNIPGMVLVRKSLGFKYVDIDLKKEGNSFHITMPYGEMKQSFAPSGDGKNPQRLENSIFSMMLSDLKICNTHYWNYKDFDRDWNFTNRSGVIADFDLKGKTRDI